VPRVLLHMDRRDIQFVMSVDEAESEDFLQPATGPAGRIPHTDYCTWQCYDKGKRENWAACDCKGCDGKAHGRGKQFALDHGFLKESPVPSRRSPADQEALFPEPNRGGPVTSPEECDLSSTERVGSKTHSDSSAAGMRSHHPPSHRQ